MVNYLTITPESAYHRGFRNLYLCSEYVHGSCKSVNNDFHGDLHCIPVLSKDWKNSDWVIYRSLGLKSYHNHQVNCFTGERHDLKSTLTLKVKNYTNHVKRSQGWVTTLVHYSNHDFPLRAILVSIFKACIRPTYSCIIKKITSCYFLFITWKPNTFCPKMFFHS